MKRKEVVQKLEKAGFTKIKNTGNAPHVKMRHPDGRWTVIPSRNELQTQLIRKIEKQTGVKLR